MNMNYIISDYITGEPVRNVGPEASRQIFEKFLVEEKGFEKTDIKINVPIIVQFKGEDYHSRIDMIAFVNEKAVMAITCVAGSIGSYEREILAGARLVCEYQIPIAISTDARDAIIMDTLTGSTIAQGMDHVPSKAELLERLDAIEFKPFSEERREREMIIYRSFNLEKVNI